ncbi:MAG: hypothetical protein AAF682_03565 [Planctomycetota bacterium]
MSPTPALRGLAPPPHDEPVCRAPVELPASKSMVIRALLAAHDATEPVRILGRLAGQDVGHAVGAVRALGSDVSVSEWEAEVAPRRRPAAAEVQVGESGTLARLVTGLLGAEEGDERVVAGSGTLHRRRSGPLFQALRDAGVGVRHLEAGDAWPAAIRGVPGVLRFEITDPLSSQEVSALLLALAQGEGDRRVIVNGAIPSRPYLEMTRRMLATFGWRTQSERRGEREILRMAGAASGGRTVSCEPDASLAAVVLAAGAILGRPALLSPLDPETLQGDARIVEHLRAFGCPVWHQPETGWLTAGGPPTQGATLDLSGEPDLAPVLAAVAAAVCLRKGAASKLTGLETLPGKESDRLRGIARALEAVGLRVETHAEPGEAWLTLAPGPYAGGGAETVELDAREDHRMVFLHGLLGLARGGGVISRGAEAVAKSWPDFWGQMKRLGCRVVEPTAPGV